MTSDRDAMWDEAVEAAIEAAKNWDDELTHNAMAKAIEAFANAALPGGLSALRQLVGGEMVLRKSGEPSALSVAALMGLPDADLLRMHDAIHRIMERRAVDMKACHKAQRPPPPPLMEAET